MGKVFIVRKDIFFIIRITIYFLLCSICVAECSLDALRHNPYTNHIRGGPALWIVFSAMVSLFILGFAVLHIFTYFNNYITIADNCIIKKTPILGEEIFLFEQITDIQFTKRNIILHFNDRKLKVLELYKLNEKTRAQILKTYKKWKFFC